MLRRLIAGFLLAAGLTACAALPRQNPGAETRLREANAALETLNMDIAAFYENLSPLLRDIRALGDLPGWNDLSFIIAFTGNTEEWEGGVSRDQELQNALDDWTARWGESGDDVLVYYRALADRCSIAEARRIGLIGHIASLQAMYLEVTFLELSAGRYPQAEVSYGTVEAISGVENELNSYVLDNLGLYEVKSAPAKAEAPP